MEFLKKHYEKVILSVVLIGLAGAVVFMMMRIEQEKKDLEEKRGKITERENPYVPLNTAILDNALARARKPTAIVLSGPHNTFNPVTWQLRPDGTRIKVVTGTEVGPAAAVVTDISPLCFILSLESVSGSSYSVGITREAATNKADRIMRKRYVSTMSPKTEFFTLKEVKGPPDNPTELVCELTETKEVVSIAKDKPYKRVDGYTMDLRYDVEARTFSKIRSGETIAFAGDEYLVEITADAVILSSKSSTKRTTLKYKAQR